MQDLQETRRESSRGFHFINTYQSCPRKWYLRYPCGLLPKYTGKALIFGKAWHNGLEQVYLGKGYDAGLATLKQELLDMQGEYQNQSDFESDYTRADILYEAWYSEVGQKLLDEYTVLHVEEELYPSVGGLFTMTIRPDAVIKRKSTGEIFIVEHKTTAYSIANMVSNVNTQDQITAYIWGLLQTKPEYKLNFTGVLLDVAFLQMRNGVPARTGAQVSQTILYRNETALGEFELNMLGLFNELGQKVKMLSSCPPKSSDFLMLQAQMFPRNGTSCSLFGCEYEDICRSRIVPSLNQSFPLYTVEPWEGWIMSEEKED